MKSFKSLFSCSNSLDDTSCLNLLFKLCYRVLPIYAFELTAGKFGKSFQLFHSAGVV